MAIQHFVVFAGLLVLLGCTESERADEKDAGDSTFQPPADWSSFATKCSFSFRAPPGTVEQISQGTDSCVTHHTVGTCELSGDYGGYSDPLIDYGDNADYSDEPTRIDGNDARLVRFRSAADGDGDGKFVAAVHFARLQNEASANIKFTLYAACDSVMGRATVLDLFKTIDFDD